MALRFIDSFDHYETADLSKKYSSVGSNVTIGAVGRCGTNALIVDLNPAFSGVVKGVPVSGNTCIFGFAIKFTGADDTLFCSIANVGNAVMTFYWGIDGSISYSTNPSAAFPTYTQCAHADSIRAGNWYYLEIKVVFSTTVGAITVHVNGGDRTVSGMTGLNTGTAWSGIFIGEASFGPITYYDDLYIADGSGDAPWNDFLGDVRVEYLQPTDNGATQDWANTGGAEAWNSVDDAAAPDEDTSYISTDTLDDVSTFVYEDAALPSGATVYGVQVSLLAIREEPGQRAISAVVREGSTDYVDSEFLYPSDESYDYRHTIMQVNPADDAAWEIDDVNDNEFGVKVVG